MEETKLNKELPKNVLVKSCKARKQSKSMADILAGLMNRHVTDIFCNEIGEVFARFTIDGIMQTHPVRGTTFKNFLTGLYYQTTGKAISREALCQVIGIAESRPLFNKHKRKTTLRCANTNNTVIYDLANDKWQSVMITAAGWKVVQSPAGMVRAANTLPQVIPEPGGEIKLLRPFLNVKNEADFLLITVWLAYCITCPDLPKPIICLHGSKGSGKSTFQRILRRLIDPAAAELTGLSSADSDVALQCDRNYLLSFDNLSKITAAQSDFLCTVSTGGAFSKRRLYSDNEEIILRFCRPVTLSGINSVAERSDLLDRCLLIELERIDKTQKTSERVFWNQFAAVKGKILGTLFDAVVYALGAPDVKLAELERMADFNEIGYKIAVGLGFAGDDFLKALSGNEEKTLDTAIKTNPVALSILTMLEGKGNFMGSSSQLHQELNSIAWQMRMGKSFPQSAAALSRSLKPMMTDLQSIGLLIEEWQEKHSKQTFYSIKKSPEISPQSPQESEVSNDAGSGRGDISGNIAESLFESFSAD